VVGSRVLDPRKSGYEFVLPIGWGENPNDSSLLIEVLTLFIISLEAGLSK
jgi:hypothetical protein